MDDEQNKMSWSPMPTAVYDGINSRSMESVTPLSMEAEWDPYVRRKQYGVGLQPIVGVLRNDRTPLNTPYTPQLMKLHLKRHEAYDERDEYVERPGKQLVTTVKSKFMLVMQPVYKIHATVDCIVTLAVPKFVLDSDLFAKMRMWIVWQLTAIVCMPFIMLLSPILIAFSICTSPIWILGITVLFFRLLIRSQRPGEVELGLDPDEESEEEETSLHHPSYLYRRARLTNNYNQQGYN